MTDDELLLVLRERDKLIEAVDARMDALEKLLETHAAGLQKVMDVSLVQEATIGQLRIDLALVQEALKPNQRH